MSDSSELTELQIALLLRGYYRSHHTKSCAFEVVEQSPEHAAALDLRDRRYLMRTSRITPFLYYFAITTAGADYVEAHLNEWKQCWRPVRWDGKIR